ncbi:hypothetical protein OIE52_47425 [Streptomyces canus]|nr:hypothetical protein [Streptomyces canus]
MISMPVPPIQASRKNSSSSLPRILSVPALAVMVSLAISRSHQGEIRHDGAGQGQLLVAEAKRQGYGDEPADRVADHDDVSGLIPFREQPVEGRLRVVDLCRVLVFRCPPEVQDQYGYPGGLGDVAGELSVDGGTEPPA